MKFKNIYSPPDKIYTCSGEKDRPNYRVSPIDGDAYELVEDGKLHSYDDIQSHANEVDFDKIISMFEKTGDETLLQRRAGFFDEAGQLPSDYRELIGQLKRADELFNGLPVEIKSNFGNSPSKFFSNAGNLAIIENYYKAKANVAKSSKKSVIAPKPESEVKLEDV